MRKWLHGYQTHALHVCIRLHVCEQDVICPYTDIQVAYVLLLSFAV